MKKTLLIIMALFVNIIGFSQTFIVNNITYNVTSTTNNTVEVTGYNINGGTNVVIPETVTPNSSSKSSNSKTSSNQMITYTITNIANNAFIGKGIITLSIPNTVTNVGSQAFADNSLTSVLLGNNIQTIGFRAFGNNQLTSIVLPNSVTDIQLRAFETNSIASVTIPSNVTNIGLGAFRYNPLTCITSLATTPPTIITEANTNDSFASNRSNINLTIPTGTTAAYTTGPGALWTGFNSVTENTGNTFVLGNITYVITSNNTVSATDYNTAGGTVVNIPATVSRACNTYSVSSIGNQAFASNNLTSVIIPNSIITINFSAFANNNLTSVIIPDSVETIGQTAFAQNNNMNSLVLGNNVTSIGEGAFAFCDLTSVIIPDSVITIDEGAFVQNNNMTSVVIGNNVTSIGDYAFRFNNLLSLTIPDSVISIGDLAFEQNTNLTSLNLGNSVETIGNNAFADNNLGSVIIPNSVLTIGNNAFAYSDGMANLVIGNSVTTIGTGAFSMNPVASNQLTTVTIPSSVTSIGDYAFSIATLTDVYSESLTPATINTTGNFFDTFSVYRNNIHLHIPAGTMGVYVTNPGALWIGFNPVTEDALSVSEFELANDIKIISNSDSIKILNSNSIHLKNFTVYSISGAKVFTGTETEIPTSFLSSGIYILKLDFDKGTVVKKIAL